MVERKEAVLQRVVVGLQVADRRLAKMLGRVEALMAGVDRNDGVGVEGRLHKIEQMT